MGGNDTPQQSMKTKTHQHREHLTGEHKAGDAGQLILFCLFIAIWVTDTFFLKYTTFLNQFVPLAARIPVGIVLLLLAAYLAKKGMAIVFGEKNQEPGVIREGIFNFVRHPIYLSELVLYLGLLTMNLSIAAAVVLIISIMFLHYISRYEEKLLLARFGEEYEQYMKEVPMWIPRFRRL